MFSLLFPQLSYFHKRCVRSKADNKCTTRNQQNLVLSIYEAYSLRGGVAQWGAHLTRNVEVVGSSPIKGPPCFLEQETLPLLSSTGWFQERIRA